MEFTLLFATLIAAAAVWLSARLRYRANPSQVNNAAFELVLNAAVFGILSGRIWAMIAAGTNPLTHLGDLIVIRGGVDPLGATLGALAALAWTSRRQGIAALDAVAPVALWGLAGWHAGCLVTGSCLGATTDLPWAMAEPGSTIGRHPVEIYAAVLLAVGAVVLSRRASSLPGMTAASALLVAASARLLTEPLRLALGGGRSLLYASGVVVALVLIAVIRRTASDAATSAQSMAPKPSPDDAHGA